MGYWFVSHGNKDDHLLLKLYLIRNENIQPFSMHVQSVLYLKKGMYTCIWGSKELECKRLF